MKYATAQAFRTALETKINEASRTGANSTVRLRKMVVFDRLLARLLTISPDGWVVKGGVALDLRLPAQARATKDLDLARHDTEEAITDELIDACDLDIGDFFEFTVRKAKTLDDGEDEVAVRFHVRADLAGRVFEQVTLDIGTADLLPDTPDVLRGSEILAFAGLATIEIPALPLEQHLAEKVHAYTRIYGERRSSTRSKDLIDMVLIQSVAAFKAHALRDACERTFETRATHPLPNRLPPSPDGWEVPYRNLAESVGLDPDVGVGQEAAARMIDPILDGRIDSDASWDPVHARWVSPFSSDVK